MAPLEDRLLNLNINDVSTIDDSNAFVGINLGTINYADTHASQG